MKKRTGAVAAALAMAVGVIAVTGVRQATSRQPLCAADVAVERAEAVEAAIVKQGSKGGEVREVQRRLKSWGYYKGSVDGVFGAGTKAAVIAFQKKKILEHS